MLRYVALAVIALSSASLGSLSSDAGNIGHYVKERVVGIGHAKGRCLFSETLCNQEKEWCYDDYAFGRCLPLYGRIREEDMFRFELGTGELHVLEKEMQRLFLLGYRWSHSYTQCVLQSLLKAIRDSSSFDGSGCNAELDQDLEGALKAIEGEEMEHIDPRNLAIVRFSPSVKNPHSNFADELYFPPVEEMLPPYPREPKPEEAGQTKEQSATQNRKEAKSPQSSNPQEPKTGVSESEPRSASKGQEGADRIKDHLEQPPPRIPLALLVGKEENKNPYLGFGGDYVAEYEPEYDLFDVEPQNYMFKRNGPKIDSKASKNYRKTSLTPADIRELAHMLGTFKPSLRSLPLEQPMYFPNKITSDYDDDPGYFMERPTVPKYQENIFPMRMAEDKIDMYAPYKNSYNKVRIQDSSQLPELNPPNDSDVPDSIHSGVVQEFEGKDNSPYYQRDEGEGMDEANMSSNEQLQNSVDRFVYKNTEDDPNGNQSPGSSGRYDWIDKINRENLKNSYSFYPKTQLNYKPHYSDSADPSLPNRPPYSPDAFNRVEYADYPDYYDYGELSELSLYPTFAKKAKEIWGRWSESWRTSTS